MQLTDFSGATVPLAAVRVADGRADTLYALWTGNKYAAIGTMDFYYKGLRIRLLDKEDPEKSRFFLSVVNGLVNTFVIRRNNSKPAVVFFVRDRERFVFNYWVKSLVKGISASAGVKSNRKFLKQYRKLRRKYALPELASQ